MRENLLQQIWMLTLENDIYERYLSRQDPHSLKGKEQLFPLKNKY